LPKKSALKALKAAFSCAGLPIPLPIGDAPLQNLTPLYAALQEQLGLKLSTTKAPAEVYVIDHVEKPSKN
jgi:hypothetical protein